METASDETILERSDIDQASEFVRPASQAQAEEAASLLQSALPRLAEFSEWVRIDLVGTDCRHFVNGRQAVLASDAGGADPVAIIVVHPDDLRRVVTGEIEGRAALLFGQIKVGGSVAWAMRFCDALAGVVRSRVSYDPAALPRPTTDISRAKKDLAEFGYCLVADALSTEKVAALRRRLVEQAEGEAAAGVGRFDGGADLPNQRVWNLINKGPEFHDLLHEELIDAFIPGMLGEHFVISSYSANIAGPGGEAQILHYDQINVQPPVRDTLIGVNMAWFLDDVTEANGGTRIMPASGQQGTAPDDPYSIEGTIAAEGRAGTALIWDSRVWHGTGPNNTDTRRHVILLYFNRYYVRPQENFSLSILPEVEATLSDRVKTMLGFRCTASLGGVEGPVEGAMVSRPAKPLGILRP